MNEVTEFRELAIGDIYHLSSSEIRRIIAKMIYDCYSRAIKILAAGQAYEFHIDIGRNVFNSAIFCQFSDINYFVDLVAPCIDNFHIFIPKDKIKIYDDKNLINVIKVRFVVSEECKVINLDLNGCYLDLDYNISKNTAELKHELNSLTINKFSILNKDNIQLLDIKKVIFHKPATIVYWMDGSKTVVKVNKGEKWDPEKGLAMAIIKKKYGLKQFLNFIE